MYSSLKFITLFSLITNFACVKASELERLVEEEDKELRQLGIHYATYFGSLACVVESIVAGINVAKFLSEKGAPAWACSSSRVLTGMIGGLIYYKTPQWTDTYLLGIKEQRSTMANITVSFCRLFAPFGCLIGENLVNKKREKRKRIIALLDEIEAEININNANIIF